MPFDRPNSPSIRGSSVSISRTGSRRQRIPSWSNGTSCSSGPFAYTSPDSMKPEVCRRHHDIGTVFEPQDMHLLADHVRDEPARSSGRAVVMFQPRRLRTRNSPSVDTIARKPSHLSSKDHPEPEGSGPGRDSIGSGSRRVQAYRSRNSLPDRKTVPGSPRRELSSTWSSIDI